MKIFGMVLVILGILGLAYGGINHTRKRTLLKVGSVSVDAKEHKRIPIPEVAGAAALIGGVALLAFSGNRRS